MIWKCYHPWKASSWKVTPNNSHKVAWKHSSARMFKDIDFLIQQSQLQLNLSGVASKHLGTMPSCIILVLSWPVLSDLYSCWTASPNETRRVYCSLEKQTKYMHHFVEWFLLLACTFLLHDVKVLKVHLWCWKHWQKVTTPKSSSNSTLVLFLLTPWIILPAFSQSKPCVFRFGASRQVTGLLYLATETPRADSW